MLAFAVVQALLFASPVLAATPDACAALVPYAEAGSADYKAGEDVLGKPVAPADLTPPFDLVGEYIIIPIELDFARRLGFAKTDGLRSEALIGVVTVEEGIAYFNGQPLADPFAAEVAALCAVHSRGGRN